MKKIKLALTLFTFLFCFGAYSKTNPTKLALNWKAEPEFGGFYTAQINKIYEKNNLTVEIIQGGAGTPTAQMIASGQVDFGIVSGDEIILSRANGAELVALFAVFQTAPYAIMTHADSKIKSFEDLYKSDVTLAVVKGLPYVHYLEKKYGTKKVKVVPYTGGISSFMNDKKFAQQCFISSEPLLAQQKGIKTNVLMVADSGFNPYTVVLATRKKLILEKPDLVKNMLLSTQEGWKNYLKNPEDTHKLIAELNPSLNIKIMSEMHPIEAKLINNSEAQKNGLGSMTQERWQQLTKQIHELGLTKKLINVDDVIYKP